MKNRRKTKTHRGKQPTKPNVKKALQKRRLELKGSDKATFTIPIIYRKTFQWEKPNIEFIPVNNRSFVIYKGDLESEEYNRELYTKIKVDINILPGYSKIRTSTRNDPERIELKEAILAASLKDRYVQIDIPKMKDQELYEATKSDMEVLDSELGFEYSTDHNGIRCTFKFPKHDIRYYAIESKACVSRAISSLKHYSDQLEKSSFDEIKSINEELLYTIKRLELLMDRYFSDAINIMWDLPNITCPGYFLWINSCELIIDDLLFITRETSNALSILKSRDLKFISEHLDIFGFIWNKALEKSLEYSETAISTINLEFSKKSIENSFLLLSNFEQDKKKIDTNQSNFIKLFTSEDSYFKDPERAARLLQASYHLNNIFQASERIMGYSIYIAKNTLRIGLFQDENAKCNIDAK